MENFNQETPKKKFNKKTLIKVASYLVVFFIGVGFGGVGGSDDAVTLEQEKPTENVQKEDDKETASTDTPAVEEAPKEDEAPKEEAPVKEEVPCPITITSVSPTTNSIGSSVIMINFTNNGTEAVKYMDFYACGWDSNGYPVKLNFGYDNFYSGKAEQPNTQPGESTQLQWTTYSADDIEISKYEVRINKVELYDGTVWTDKNAAIEINELSGKTNK